MSKPEVYIYEKKLKREVVTTSCVYNETLVTRIESGVYRKKGKLIVFFFKSDRRLEVSGGVQQL